MAAVVHIVYKINYFLCKFFIDFFIIILYNIYIITKDITKMITIKLNNILKVVTIEELVALVDDNNKVEIMGVEE